jgi:hypothetical protein
MLSSGRSHKRTQTNTQTHTHTHTLSLSLSLFLSLSLSLSLSLCHSLCHTATMSQTRAQTHSQRRGLPGSMTGSTADTFAGRCAAVSSPFLWMCLRERVCVCVCVCVSPCMLSRTKAHSHRNTQISAHLNTQSVAIVSGGTDGRPAPAGKTGNATGLPRRYMTTAAGDAEASAASTSDTLQAVLWRG